jgi:hypothetical protein
VEVNVTHDAYTPIEQRLLDAWFSGRALSDQDKALLEEFGFGNGWGDDYTPLDAWVAAFAVQDIQERLPNCGFERGDGDFSLTREIGQDCPRKVTGPAQLLFSINWADSGPGFSWPAEYNLVWLPGHDRWVLTCSTDGPDMFGYSDFALGSIGVNDDLREAARKIVVNDWERQQLNEQPRWSDFLAKGLIPKKEAMAWRKEVWGRS